MCTAAVGDDAELAGVLQELVARGFKKMIAEYDGKLASAAGDKKVLSRANVEQYLSEFGLDDEIASHQHIKGLSGGQKVKLVLAAGADFTNTLLCPALRFDG